ncbi:Ubiquitin carboxyl-terminal hydrolase [Quillaja saponaria]|uniref:ubiquitinyl hydrolase 1 n=1 Tax=Quillaja saponaria TaxID=32244 RepID=A0AAD7PSI0_QUISA|nr:Ubiquitin carboxyl-terminal hydrolase [Quillaja saponaria]
MLVSGVSFDLNWFLQFIFTVFIIAVGLLHLVKNTASKYFEVDANFEGDHPSDRSPMPGALMDNSTCAVCGNSGTKKCSRCKAVRYCSLKCQQTDWRSGHNTKCKEFQLVSGQNSTPNMVTNSVVKASSLGDRSSSAIMLRPGRGTSKIIKQPKNVLFPYEEFVEFFNWDKMDLPPCGLLNAQNSCFANVVLQCLAFTRPLVAYLLEKGHRRECCRNDWCFLCEFQAHVERSSRSSQAFLPMNILSHLPNIGGTLGYGRQEDAHEFMRFAIDAMQSVCLDEFGGEKAVDPRSQETTLIQHTFGGHLQSQVICTKCDKISNQYESMMDLTVEIQGDAASLEECLDQFTVKEWLHGDNMYKCDGCNEYVKAWKRLTIKRAPNILTIALKRFQSGRFGKLNKRITFPETLDLSPYMSEAADGSDIYKLYAVVVHVDMLNASYFGHYICYVKDFGGNWYKIDDWKVMSVELEEVLSQGAYMLLYRRVCARPTCLKFVDSSGKEEKQMVRVEVEPCQKEQAECLSTMEPTTTCSNYEVLLTNRSSPQLNGSGSENESLTGMDSNAARAHSEDIDVDGESSSSVPNGISCHAVELSRGLSSEAGKESLADLNRVKSDTCLSVSEEASGCTNDSSVELDSKAVRDGQDNNEMDLSGGSCTALVNDIHYFEKDFSVPMDYECKREDMMRIDETEVYGNGHISIDETTPPTQTLVSCIDYFPTETSSVEPHQLKRRLPFCNSETDDGNGISSVEIIGDNL